MDLSFVQALVERYATTLGIAAPTLRLTDAGGPFYEPVQNRLNLDEDTLGLTEEALEVIVAHEMGHALTRWASLRGLGWTLLSLVPAVTIPLGIAAACPFNLGVRGIISAALLTLGLRAHVTYWAPRVERDILADELAADRVAVSFCGADAVLATLEATIACGDIKYQDERLQALHAAVAEGK